MSQRSYIKKRIFVLCDRWVALTNKVSSQIESYGRVNRFLEGDRRKVERQLNYWKKRWAEYQPPVKKPEPDPWKGEGRYVCHVDIPEEVES